MKQIARLGQVFAPLRRDDGDQCAFLRKNVLELDRIHGVVRHAEATDGASLAHQLKAVVERVHLVPDRLDADVGLVPTRRESLPGSMD